MVASVMCLRRETRGRPKSYIYAKAGLKEQSVDSITLVITDIFGPRSQTDHPDRFLNCQEAIEAAFASLAERAVAAGWGEAEVAAALVDVADCHMLSLKANMETEKIIREAASRSAIKKT
jgi:hypothetical protein